MQSHCCTLQLLKVLGKESHVMVHICMSSTQRVEAGDQKLERSILGYMKPCQKMKTNKDPKCLNGDLNTLSSVNSIFSVILLIMILQFIVTYLGIDRKLNKA